MLRGKMLVKRLLQIVIVLIGISFLSYLLITLAPGDAAQSMFTASGIVPTEEQLESLRDQMGLNDPFIVQYGNWLSGCLKGDFGTSFAQGRPVGEMLAERVMPTIRLALLSLVIMLIVAIPIGIISATHQNKFSDYIIRGFTFFGISMPNFWVGLLLLYFFGVLLRVVPVYSTSMGFERMILPAVTLAIAMSSKYARQVRAAILEELNRDYVYGARARGLKERTILWRHVMPNAMLPLVTMLGLSLGSLLGGTAVVEVIFSYPGLGDLAISSITSLDYPVIQGYVLWISLIYMVVNLLVDLSYGILNPKLRKGV